MGFLINKWLDVGENDDKSNLFYKIYRQLPHYSCKKLARIAIECPNKQLCYEAINNFGYKSDVYENINALKNVIENAPYDIVRSEAAIIYYKHYRDIDLINSLFEELKDDSARIKLSKYIEDTKYLPALHSLNKQNLSGSDRNILHYQIDRLEKQKENEIIKNEVDKLETIDDIKVLNKMLDYKFNYLEEKDTEKYYSSVLKRIYQIDDNTLVSIICNKNTRKINDLGLKIIDSILTINKLLNHKESFDDAYKAKIEQRKQMIISEKLCPNGSHIFEYKRTYGDMYDNEIQINTDVYICKRCGLIKEDEKWDSGYRQIHYHWSGVVDECNINN